MLSDAKTTAALPEEGEAATHLILVVVGVIVVVVIVVIVVVVICIRCYRCCSRGG